MITVAGLIPLASGWRKSTSIGFDKGEKNRRCPSMLPQACGLVVIPRLRVTASWLGIDTRHAPPVSVNSPSVSKQYVANEAYGPLHRRCISWWLKVNESELKPPSGALTCMSWPRAKEPFSSGRRPTRHEGASLQE